MRFDRGPGMSRNGLPKYANVVAAVTEMTFAVSGLEANMLLSARSRRLNRPTSMTSAINPITPNRGLERIFKLHA